MILAAFGGLAGNPRALNVILEAIDNEGIQTLVNTGDSLLGDSPNEVIDTLLAREIPVVMGQEDRRVIRFRRKRKSLEKKLDSAAFSAVEAAHGRVSAANLERVAGFPTLRELTVDGVVIGLFSGTVNSATEFLRADDDDARFRRQREALPARVFVCGGREPFVRRVDDAIFVCPGSARAENGTVQYAIISTENEPFEAELRTLDVPTT